MNTMIVSEIRRFFVIFIINIVTELIQVFIVLKNPKPDVFNLLIWFDEYWSSRSMHLMFACVKWPVTNLTSDWAAHIMTIEPFSLYCSFSEKMKLEVVNQQI